MLQVQIPHPIHLPPQVIPRVDHLVRERVLQVLPVPDLVGADHDAVGGAEAARLAVDLAVLGQARGAPAALDVGRVEGAVEAGDLFVEEAHGRGEGEEPVAVLLAALAVALLVGAIPGFAVVEGAFGCHAAREDVEVVHPPLCLRVEAGAGGVVGELARWLFLLLLLCGW